MRLTKLLGFKLFVIILGVMIAGTFVFATFTINWHSEQYLHAKVQSVNGMSDVLNRSMHYSMLLNRREDIYQVIQTVGNEPGIEVVRIYNKKGEITFSSDSSQAGSTVALSDKACSACHSKGRLPTAPNPSELIRIFQSEKGYRILGMITPIKNEPSCSSAECHAHPESQTILGVLDFMVPLDELDASLGELKRVQYVSAMIMVGAVTSFAGVFIWLMVNIPVRKLTKGTEEVRRGNLHHRIPVKSTDEIGTLAESFNYMTDDLQRARNELTEWNRMLEERVKEKTEALQRAQSNMIQMEKMISLGTLAATVAHELNNPLEGVLTYAKLLKRRFSSGEIRPEELADVQSELSTIADETARCGNIVKNLLLFSRQRVGEFREAEVRAIIEQSLKLIDHHLKIHNITLETVFGERSIALICDANQLEQAFLAIEINAVEAMPEGGTLRVEILDDQPGNTVSIRVSDTGGGIRDEDLPHIFEPFYTTKQDGKGTGLGLAVVYGIIERHGGTIEVQSRVHKGTTFTIRLPRTLS